MGRRRMSEGPNKSAFIREQLRKSPNAGARDVADAWSKEGHPGEISQTLYYQVKKNMASGHPKREREKISAAPAPAPAPAAAAAPRRAVSAPVASTGNSGYLVIEQTLDALVQQAEDIPDSDLAADLRLARRRVSAKLID